MQGRSYAAPALAGLLVLPVAGIAALGLMQPSMFGLRGDNSGEVGEAGPQATPEPARMRGAEGESRVATVDAVAPAPSYKPAPPVAQTAPAIPFRDNSRVGRSPLSAANPKLMAEPAAPPPMLGQDSDAGLPEPESRDRLADFETNPVRSTIEDPVSTFSLDVDTASYSFVRRSLREGFLPQADTVRVEEMINYFPYDWPKPVDAATPFQPTVTLAPSPWKKDTRLLHVAIQGYDIEPVSRPRANLVFLLDVSGSMNGADRLPLVQSAFRLLIGKLAPDDTVSIVTYAGQSGVVLEPTRAAERDRILDAIDKLQPGGTTAGEAGILDAYRLAEKSFVDGGVNRILLATDGDFNVGASDDDALKRLVEEKRRSGVMLSVLGFGRGNNNDQLMQALAQNGNGAAAYIDTLAEAEKVLVEEARSTLFPIAKDVKIQVEFNPAAISEYRLIGYETRALNREDFNNDRVDAGEIGSGHSVTAIYEITPKGSPDKIVDDLRYGAARTDNAAGIVDAGEYAFVKIRYKLPEEDVSKLITTPVTAANAIASLDEASDDIRFSVAAAAFGQKLRDADATVAFSYEEIAAMAAKARGLDPFGYRSEFLSLVRLAASLDRAKL